MVRKNCDYNPHELLVAAAMAGIRSSCLPRNSLKITDHLILKFNSSHYEKYINEVSRIEKQSNYNQIIERYINMKTHIESHYDSSIKKVFLVGKSDICFINNSDYQIVKEFNEILKQSVPISDRRKVCKADVYLILENMQVIGISVKANKNCTKCNFSIEKIFKTIDDDNSCSSIRQNYLIENDITRKNLKNKRPEYNALFYSRDNPYWNEVSSFISENSHVIARQLYNNIKCLNNTLYPMWEVNGESYYVLEGQNDDYTLVENTEKKEKTKAAKLFYRLMLGDNTLLNMEIRFKGNPYHSPQFLTAA